MLFSCPGNGLRTPTLRLMHLLRHSVVPYLLTTDYYSGSVAVLSSSRSNRNGGMRKGLGSFRVVSGNLLVATSRLKTLSVFASFT